MTVAELLALERCGLTRAGVVQATQVVHLHDRGWGRTVTTEVTDFTRVLTDARAAALAGLTADATALGARGVVGVTLALHELEIGRGVWEVLATGTAVTADVAGPVFTSGLSGQDLWLLHQAGHAPVGLLVGCGVHHFGRLRRTLTSHEVAPLTEAVTAAREWALRRMQEQVGGLGAAGVLDVRLEVLPCPLGRGLVEVRATGTAVARVGDTRPPRPAVVVPLR